VCGIRAIHSSCSPRDLELFQKTAAALNLKMIGNEVMVTEPSPQSLPQVASRLCRGFNNDKIVKTPMIYSVSYFDLGCV